MPAPQEVYIHGTDGAYDLKDEPEVNPSVLVETFSAKATRERIEYRNRNRAFRKLKYVNPLLVMAFAGYIGQYTGLAIQHPGTQVTSLANFQAERLGFDPTVGTMILEDPENELSLEDDAKTKFNVVHAPFVESA